jgi:cyclopropane fatty-acyl-phospholipid synthase-like methyltransferase
MDDMKLIIDFYKDLENLGPGSKAITKQALDLTGLIDKQNLKVADIGCGTGASTLFLAQNLDAEIKAVDLFTQFLDKLDDRAKQKSLDSKITTISASMDDLPFDESSFDLIWSEGAIYNIGFENGIKQFKKFLNDDGVLAASEITWLTAQRPDEITQYWETNYPEIATASIKIKVLEDNGYKLLGYFALPADAWLKEYYEPMEKNFDTYLASHDNSDDAKAIVDESVNEIAMFKKYKDYYSYGFYIAQKVK